MELRFKIKEIPSIDRGGAPIRLARSIDRDLLAAVLENRDADVSKAHADLEVELSRDHEEVLVRGTLRGALELPCARCIEPAHVPLNLRVDAMYVRAGTVPADEDGEDLDDPKDIEAVLNEPDRLEHDGKTIDLAELVRELLIAELPISPLCTSQCRGLCVVCGANFNTAEGRACGHSANAEPLPTTKNSLAALGNLKI